MRRILLLLMSFSWKCLPAVLLLFAATTGYGQQHTPKATVEMQYCGMRMGRPPLKYISFNLTMRNSTDKPQWFLFPAALYEKAQEARKNAGIDAIELFSDSPDHKVTVVYFMGTMKLQPEGAGGFKGILLPAGAIISVRGFEISFWGEPASPVPVQVMLADHVTMDGSPVEQWVGKSLLSAKTADVRNLDRAGSKMANDLKELPVEITKSGEITITDAMGKSCPEESR